MLIGTNDWEVETYKEKVFEDSNKRASLPSTTFFIFVGARTLFSDGPKFLLIGSETKLDLLCTKSGPTSNPSSGSTP